MYSAFDNWLVFKREESLFKREAACVKSGKIYLLKASISGCDFSGCPVS